jgi:hypothetical protein
MHTVYCLHSAIDSGWYDSAIPLPGNTSIQPQAYLHSSLQAGWEEVDSWTTGVILELSYGVNFERTTTSRFPSLRQLARHCNATGLLIYAAINLSRALREVVRPDGREA